MSLKDRKEKKLNAQQAEISATHGIEREENIDITEKYSELFEKIDIEHDYDDILEEYEKTLDKRAEDAIRRVSSSDEQGAEPAAQEKAEQPQTNAAELESSDEEELEKPETESASTQLYAAIESLGWMFDRGVKRVLHGPKKLLRRAVFLIEYLVRFAVLLVKKLAHLIGDNFVSQTREFKADVRSAMRYLKRSRGSFATTVSVLVHYVKKAFVRHKQMFVTIANAALPVLAIIAFAATVNYWSSVTFALKVNYNDKNIGYISDETVYNEAQAAAKSRIENERRDSGAKLKVPTYELSLVSVNELVDSSVLCDRIIDNSEDNVTNACGIYIDDEFLCAIKNETDATSVFNAILEPYKKQINDDKSFVDFVEKVEYVQGLYPDNEDSMWDAADLSDKLSTTKQSAVKYTVKEGDTVYGIAVEHGLTEKQLLDLNPQVEEDIFVGDTLTISNEVNYLQVKVMKPETRKVEVAYEVEKTNNASMFKGTSKTTRKGEKGEDTVTELVTYIDGKRVSAQEISRERTKDPVSEKVQVGTKSTTVSGNYNVTVSRSGFVWPAPACHTVSSPYGWRSYNGGEFHKGVDLVKPGRQSRGTVIVASLDGTVESVQRSGRGYGHCIVINHGGGLKTRYAHCLPGSISVSVGQHVSAGQAIARVGESGNAQGAHLHFEIIVNGRTVDPLPYIR